MQGKGGENAERAGKIRSVSAMNGKDRRHKMAATAATAVIATVALITLYYTVKSNFSSEVSAQIAAVSVKISESVKRLDSADQNTNDKIRDFAKHIDRRFDDMQASIKELREDIRSNGKKIDAILLKLSTPQK